MTVLKYSHNTRMGMHRRKCIAKEFHAFLDYLQFILPSPTVNYLGSVIMSRQKFEKEEM